MHQYEHIREFVAEGIAYVDRQELLMPELTSQLDALVRDRSKFMELNQEIYGLHAAPLESHDGTEEHVLAIVQDYQADRFVVFVSILSGSIEDVKALCANSIWKRKINIAVGRLIAMCRFGNGWGTAKEA